MRAAKSPSTFCLVFVALFAVGAACGADGAITAAMRVGTYNVRCSPADRGTPNAWAERKDDLLAMLRKLDLDAGGLQEVCPDQLAFFREGMPEYEFVGDGRKANRSGEASPVFWRKGRFACLKRGTFWLSETPDKPGTKGWDAGYQRVCTYAILRDTRTGGFVCFANAHIDEAPVSGEMGMALIMKRIGMIVGRFEALHRRISVVFTGDHNCVETEEAAQEAAKHLKDALFLAETPPKGPWRTYNGRNWRDHEISAVDAMKMPIEKRNVFKKFGGLRVDYIYVSDGVRVLDYAIDASPRPGGVPLYPSDHFPLAATVEFPQPHNN